MRCDKSKNEKTKETTLAERQLIVNLYQRGYTYAKIADEIGKGISTVGYIIKKFKDENLIANKSRKGRPKKLTEREEKRILREVKQNPRTSATNIVSHLATYSGKTVSTETVKRVLRKAGYGGRVARKKPYINDVNRRKRLAFAKEHQNKPPEFWRRVLWSDETKINLFGSDGRQYVWRKRGTAFNKENLLPSVKHGGGSVMIWGCMAANGVGNIEIIDGIMDRFVYLDILKRNVQLSVDKLGLRDKYVFQHDNYPKHTARLVKEWLLYNTPHCLHTPPQSPDLNPIEHLWGELKRRVHKHQISKKDHLIAAIREEWQKMDSSTTRKLVDSMPKRLAAVIQAHGYATKY